MHIRLDSSALEPRSKERKIEHTAAARAWATSLTYCSIDKEIEIVNVKD